MGAPRDCAASLVVFWPESTQLWVAGSVVRLEATSKRLLRQGRTFSDWFPHPCGEPLWTHTSIGGPPTWAGSPGSVSCGATAPCPWVLVAHKVLFLPSQDWSLCFPPILWSNPTGLQGQIPWGLPAPLLDTQAGKPDVRFTTFTTVGELLWYHCSLVRVTHPAGVGFGFIVIVPLLPSTISLWLLCLWRWGIFGRFQHHPVAGSPAASCDFGALPGGDEHVSFYFAVLNHGVKLICNAVFVVGVVLVWIC